MPEKPNRDENDNMRTNETWKTREARHSVPGQDGQTSITIGQGDISEYLVIEIKFMREGDDICYIGYHESISDDELATLFDEELEAMFDEVVEHVPPGAMRPPFCVSMRCFRRRLSIGWGVNEGGSREPFH